MSVADLQLFSSERFGKLRATQIDCEVWFAATDVAKALGYRDANQITRALDDDEKRWSEGTLSECTHSHLGIRLINESGLYRVLMRSQRPEAIPFQRWLAHEVVPEIRRDGYLGKSGSNRNVPTQRSMDMGLFRIKETAVTHSDGRVTLSRTPKVTGKGTIYFMKKYGVLNG